MDIKTTAWSGHIEFRRPFPKDNYTEDVQWNGLLLSAMRYVYNVLELDKKKRDKWEKEDNRLFMELMNG